MTKRCNKCKEDKALSEFYKDKSRKDGLNYHCKECDRAYGAAWYKVNADKKREHSAAWKKANLEKVRGYNATYRQNNIDKHRARSAAWTKANPEKSRAKNARRRALKAGASVSYLPPTYLIALFNFYGNKCMKPGCEKEINASNPLTEDHVIPLANGGAHAFYNLQVLCKSCNSSKRDYSTQDYRNGRMLVGAHDPKFSLWDYMQGHKQVIIGMREQH